MLRMGKVRIITLMAVVLLIASISVSFAGIIYVKANGNNKNCGNSWAEAKKTVQAGLNASIPGDEIWVAAGTYQECITMRSGVALYGGFEGDESKRSEREPSEYITILDGNQLGGVVTVPEESEDDTIIDGFTIRNGSSASHGGAIYCCDASPIISNNIITKNIAAQNGGAIYCYDSEAQILNNTITNNFAQGSGGAIHCEESETVISNNLIANNDATYRSGGIECVDSEAKITNNTIVVNGGDQGGGIDCNGGSPVIINNIVAFNYSGINKGGTPTIEYNCVYGNQLFDYSDWLPGFMDIPEDPIFVNRSGRDYHLSATSPCINAGSNDAISDSDKDIDGQRRIKAKTVDIGADEYGADAPENVSLIFGSGPISVGCPRIFETKFSDPNGSDDIAYCNLEFTGTGIQPIYLAYSADTHSIAVWNDAKGKWSAGAMPGSSAVLETSQVKVYCDGTQVIGADTVLTIKWKIEFKSVMASKTLYAYMKVGDFKELESEREWKGLFTIMGKQPLSPSVVGLTPNKCGIPVDTVQTFAAKYSDPNGCADFGNCYLLINTGLSSYKAVYVRYDHNTKKLYLRNDNDTMWVGGYTLGSTYTIENSRCKIFCYDTTVSESGNTLTVNWRIKFKPIMTQKTCGAWMLAIDDEFLSTNWKKTGDFKLSYAPQNVSLSPKDATIKGNTVCTFTSKYTDADGAGDISRCYLLVNTSNKAVGAIYVKYDAAENKVYLRSDDDKTWLGGYTPGSKSRMENSQCMLLCEGTKVTKSGKDVTVGWQILIKKTQSGKTLCAWMTVADKADLQDNWDQLGIFKIK